MFFLAFFAETRMLLFRYGNVYRGGIRVYPLRGGRHVGVGPLGGGRTAWGESSLAWGPRADAFCTCPQYHTHAVGKGSKGAIFSLVSIPQAGPIPDVTNRYGLIS